MAATLVGLWEEGSERGKIIEQSRISLKYISNLFCRMDLVLGFIKKLKEKCVSLLSPESVCQELATFIAVFVEGTSAFGQCGFSPIPCEEAQLVSEPYSL